MACRKYTPGQIISKLREVEVALAEGVMVSLAARGIGVTDQTYYPGVGSTAISPLNRPNA